MDVGNGCWKMDFGKWILEDGFWKMDVGRWIQNFALEYINLIKFVVKFPWKRFLKIH